MIPDFTRYLDYDKEGGNLFWRKVSKYHKEKLGEEVGWITSTGYRYFKLGHKSYPYHRVIYYLETGRWYDLEIDHINNDKLDNRFSNLREVNRSQNIKNTPARSTNKLGEKYIRKLGHKYQVRYDGKSYGCYDTIEEAKSVRYEVAVKLNLEYWMVQVKGEKYDPPRSG